MKSRSTIFTLLALGGIVLLIGCGNRSHRERIAPVKDSQTGEKARQCQQTIRSRDIQVDSEKVTMAGKSISAPFCRLAQPLKDYSPYTSESTEAPPKASYQLSSPQRLRYTVGKGEGKNSVVKLRLVVDFVLDPSERSGTADTELIKKLRYDAFKALKEDCVSLLSETWKSSRLNVGLDIDLDRADTESEVSPDQIIVLAGSKASQEVKSPRFVLASWPTHGQLFIRAPAGGEGCETASCEHTQRTKLNRPFCARFARLVGQYLGLSAHEASSEAACGANALTEDVKPTAAPQDFMSYDPKSLDFWEKARFSVADLKTILAPACFGQAPPPPKKP